MDPICCATLVLVAFAFLAICMIGTHLESVEEKIDRIETRLAAILATLADDKEVGSRRPHP